MDSPAPRVPDPERLAALRRTALLDTPAEESFDRLTRFAARLLDVPVALVSLVDEQRQFFKSQCGLPEPWASRRETPLSHSFCQHVVESAEPLIVEDAREHPLLRDNLAIRDLSVVAYAGIPLVSREGFVLGSFCAIDSRPRHWTEAEIAVLRDLALSAMTEIELRLEVQERREAEEQRQRLVERLEEERTRLLNVFMEAPAAIAFHRGPEHVLEIANPMFLRLVGYREVIGLPIRQALPELEGQPFFGLLDEVFRTGRPYAGREVAARWDRDGSGMLGEGYFNFVYQPLLGASGGVEGVLLHAVEVTEQVVGRKQVEKLAAERNAILQQIADGVIVADAEGRITFVNAAAQRMHGLSRTGVGVDAYAETYRLFRLDGSPYPSEELPLARAVVRGERVLDAEWVIRRADGDEVIARGSATPVADEQGNQIGAVLTIHDVTEQRRLERQQAELLEERQAAQARIASMLEARGRFFTAMSHELRTPINAILGYTGLLLDGIYGSTSEAQTEALRKSKRAADHLLELVNDILDLSKLEAGRLEVQTEPVDLYLLAAEVAETVRPLAEERGSEVRVEGGAGLVLETDPRRVRQILLNLLSNAIKFGAGRPVRVRCARGDAGQLVVEVVDRGVGIPPEELPRVFEEFVQLGAEQGGTGLGLPISRRLAEALGGALDAESSPGQGSTFRLRLPAAPAPLPPRGLPEP